MSDVWHMRSVDALGEDLGARCDAWVKQTNEEPRMTRRVDRERDTPTHRMVGIGVMNEE